MNNFNDEYEKNKIAKMDICDEIILVVGIWNSWV